MDEESQVTTEELDKDAAEESAGFAASFGNEARSDELPANEDETQQANEADASQGAAADTDAGTQGEAQQDQQQEQQQQQQSEVDEQAAAEVLVAGLKPDELNALLAKIPKIEELTNAETRKLYGKLGEIKRDLMQIQEQGGSKKAVSLANAKFERLKENFPELAELLAEDLKDVTAEVAASGEAMPQAQLDEIINQRVTNATLQQSQMFEARLLKIQHPDYKQVYASDEFNVWKQTLPAEDQAKIEDTWDSDYLAGKLSDFKEWRNKKNQGTQKRTNTLQRAITPKTTQAAAKPGLLTEEDGFAASFKR